MINTGKEQQILLSFYSNLSFLYGMKKITLLQPLWNPSPSSCDAGEYKVREKGVGLAGACASCMFSSPPPHAIFPYLALAQTDQRGHQI